MARRLVQVLALVNIALLVPTCIIPPAAAQSTDSDPCRRRCENLSKFYERIYRNWQAMIKECSDRCIVTARPLPIGAIRPATESIIIRTSTTGAAITRSPSFINTTAATTFTTVPTTVEITTSTATSTTTQTTTGSTVIPTTIQTTAPTSTAIPNTVMVPSSSEYTTVPTTMQTTTAASTTIPTTTTTETTTTPTTTSTTTLTTTQPTTTTSTTIPTTTTTETITTPTTTSTTTTPTTTPQTTATTSTTIPATTTTETTTIPTTTSTTTPTTTQTTTTTPPTTSATATTTESSAIPTTVQTTTTTTNVPTTTVETTTPSTSDDVSITTSVAATPPSTEATSLECGKQRSGIHQHRQRVIGGFTAEECEYPWLTFVSVINNACAGAILSKRHILTAAHCVKDRRTNEPVQNQVVHVRAGSSIIPNAKIYSVVNITTHPGHDPISKVNDAAVLTLAEDIIYSDCAAPICLPQAGLNPRDAKNCVVAGWGVTDTSAPSSTPYLQEVELPIIDQELCLRRYGPNKVNELTFCAGNYYTGGIDSCQGDSGAPLMCRDQDRYVVRGIVSNGIGCAMPTYPGIYTNVAHPEILQFITTALLSD